LKYLKLKVSTLKHCIQEIVKMDTTNMSVEMMKEILLNTFEKKDKPTAGKVYICTMKRGLARYR
jgi:hypothetical protein